METILENLSMDATAGKLKAITDACDEGLEALSKERIGRPIEPYELREKCLLPLKLALESRVSKLSPHALGGFHKLISDERFQSLVEGDVHRQLPVQFVNAVVSTPSLSDEIQVEIMKMLLMITCSASCEVHGEYLIKIAEVCIETYIRTTQTWTKTACRATLTQMLTSVCNDLEESLKKEMLSQHSKEIPHSVRGLDLISTDSSKILSQDVLMLMKHFCSRLSPNQSSSVQMSDALPLYLEAVFVIVSSLSVAIRQEKDFINVLWQFLCPTLIHLLGSPVSEVGLKSKNHSSYPEDGGRGGRSAGSPLKSRLVLQSVSRIIYSISKELVRLVGPLSTMRPVLESLFHRIILYPPPQHRSEALRAINDILASPCHVVDVAGPVILDPDSPPSPDSPTEQKKSEVDLLKVLLDGIVECSHCADLSVVGGSVACIVALLGSLEELSQGEGLSQGQLALLNKLGDVDGWEKVEQKNYNDGAEDSPRTIPKFTLADETFDEGEHTEHNHGKPKHIRWEMDEEPRTASSHTQLQLDLDQEDLETVTQRFVNSDRLWDISRTNPDGREHDVSEESSLLSHPKSVHFAADLEEEFTIENREDQRIGRYGNIQRPGAPRRSGVPRRIASSPVRSGIRRSASLDGKSKSRPVIQSNERRRVDGENAQVKNSRNDREKPRGQLQRSNSDLGNSPTDETETLGNPDDISEAGVRHYDRRQGLSRPILRKSKLVSELPDQLDSPVDGRPGKPRGILLHSNLGEPANRKHGVVKINGILISRSRDSRGQVSPEKAVSGPARIIEKRKTVEENEKEGARNFARCLLGILPSVLSLHDPVAVDEALQQFASDVCEAVTCMALKRKNVPNFGTLRGSSDLLDDNSGKGATSYLHYPILNADGVYAAVYATLKLNLKLHRAGYYETKQEQELVTQDEFVQNTHNCGVDVGLSSVWLGELYRLVTTYDILEKAGYKADDVSSNRALIELLSDNPRVTANNDETTTSEVMFIRVHDQASMTVTQKQGIKFVRRILHLTWDSLLEVLRVPIESPLIGTVNESIGMALMMASDGKKHHNKERDMVCLSLDGLRRVARLFCTLGIQTGCETVLSQLANASCGGEKGSVPGVKSKAGHWKGGMRLHAAHVLTMDALLAVGLELGSHAPTCWKHVFRCCSYIAGLQNAQFLADTPELHSSHKVVEVSSPISDASTASDFVSADLSSDGSASDIVRQHHDETPDTTGMLSANDASRAIYALSTSVDRLFEQAANTLSSDAIVAMLESLAEASADQLEKQYSTGLTFDPRVVTLGGASLPSNLHFCRMVDILLRCTRDGKRPLLHLMRAWATFADHFVKISCDSKKMIFTFALDLVKDALVVLLNNRNELPHFWFHETLFKPFEKILLSGMITDADQEEVLNMLCELVHTNAGNIKSGWRVICCAARAIRLSSLPAAVTTDQDQPIPRILEIVSSFVENRTALVFSQGAVDGILCLSKCLHVQPGADDASDDRSLHGSETGSEFSEGPYGEMCVPALELLSTISKKLAAIYAKPANVIFHGSHAVKLDNSSSPLSSPSSPLMSVADAVKHQESAPALNYARSITAKDDSGIFRVWYLLLDALTTTVITCPRRYQLQALDKLFEVLHSVCSVPGPQFSILALTHLLLPMLHAWLQRGIQSVSYWERTSGNFKQACGLTTELIVAEMGHFLSDQGASECVSTLMKQVLHLLKTAVSQADEVIARVGCSCFRHLLMSGGSLFTEEIWRIICEGLRDSMRSTLAPVRSLIPCYQAGSSNISGDNGFRVRVLTRRDASWEETIRHGQLAEQVFLLESQLEDELDQSDDEFAVNENDGQRSFFFVVSSGDSQDSPDETTRVTLRGLVVGLLAHQLLLQSLGLVLLDNSEVSLASLSKTPSKPDDQVDGSMLGLLNHLSPSNLSIIFDCLMESHTVAYEFNNRFGLRSLIQMIMRLCAPANLLRQSTMAFKFYLQTLLEICRYNGEHMSGSSVKRILIGDRSFSPDGENVQRFPEAAATPSIGNSHLTEDKDAEWIVRRLSEACSQLSSVYNRLYSSYNGSSEESERNLTSTPVSSPAKLRLHFGDDSAGSIRRKVESPDILKSDPFYAKDRHHAQLRRADDLLQLKTWTAMAVDMIEALLELPTLQFKPILPAIFPAVTSMIPVTGDPKVCRLIYDVVTRVGSIYGIV